MYLSLFAADKLLYERALWDQLGAEGEEMTVAFDEAIHCFTVFSGILSLLQQFGDDGSVQKRLIIVTGIDKDIGGACWTPVTSG